MYIIPNSNTIYSRYKHIYVYMCVNIYIDMGILSSENRIRTSKS